MPEGDTILRAARVLARALEGHAVVRFTSPVANGADLAGRRIDAVEAVGKYLLVRFDDGRVLTTHMKMTGSWHIYRVGEPWRRGASLARAVIETDAYVAVCFHAPVVRLESARRAARALHGLGPDILAESADEAAILARLKAEPHLEIGEAVLAQRLVAGIGNVYKSEALFCARVDPRAKVGELPDAVLARIVGEARRLMRANLGPGPRRTRGGREPTWVYGRLGAPCHVCTTKVARVYQGPLGARRSTYFCPKCQAPLHRVAVDP
jgi:endonuclease-8